MICIILRNIDTETTDYELLLFGYLKAWSLNLDTHILAYKNRLRVVCGIAHLAS